MVWFGLVLEATTRPPINCLSCFKLVAEDAAAAKGRKLTGAVGRNQGFKKLPKMLIGLEKFGSPRLDKPNPT